MDEPVTPMHDALALAQLAIGLSEPNPRVGCVITATDGRVIGRGHTQQAGGPHAEVMALRDLRQRGESSQGATVYVTLEPCSHHGRTPPCADALIAARVARVVAALEDPNPQVSGQGFAARPPLGHGETRRQSRRAHGARQRRQPLDHGRGSAAGCA